MDSTFKQQSRKQKLTGFWQTIKKDKKGDRETRKRSRIEQQNVSYEVLPMCGLEVKIPAGVKPYPSQKLIITRIINALNHRQNVLAESPTGSGKTLALLASSCAWMANYLRQRKESKDKCPVHNGDLHYFDESITNKDETLYDDSDPICLDENEDPKFNHHDEYESDFVGSPTTKLTESFILDAKKQECICLPKVRIYYGTRTHKQIGQVVKEFSRLPYAGILRHTILGSREQSCINDSVREAHDITAKCKELIANQGPGCVYKSNIRNFKMEQAPPLRKHIAQTAPPIFDIEDLVEALRSNSPVLCPYFASTRILTQDADVIFCPFSYLVDPIIRTSSDVSLKNSIVILDEAHNIEDTCRESASFTFHEKEIADALCNLRDKESSVHEYLAGYNGLEGADQNAITRLMDLSKAYAVLVKLTSSIRNWFIERAMPVTKDKPDFNKCRQRTDTWAVLYDSLVSFKSNPPLLVIPDSPEYNEIFDSFKVLLGQNEEFGDNSAVFDLLKPSGVAIVLIEKWLYFQGFFSKEEYRTCYRLNVLIEQISAPSTTNIMVSYEPQNSQGPKNSMYNDTASSIWLDSTTGPQGMKPVLEGCKSSISLWCMSPEITFMDAFKESRSVILASGTLCPTETLTTELGMEFKTQVEGNQVIDKKNIFAAILPIGPDGREITATANNLQAGSATIHSILAVIADLCFTVPKGILVFTPSYKVLKDLVVRMRLSATDRRILKRKIILEEPRRSSELQQVMDQYENAIRNPKSFGEGIDGAVMFAVFRGKISEGIDFADDLARLVLSIGIPYPYIGDGVVKEKKKYNNEYFLTKKILNGDQWYHTQAYRALNQALGRGLRHKNDWSALVMLDSRLRNQVNNIAEKSSTRVSKWIREQSVYYENYEDFSRNLEMYVQEMTNGHH